MRTENTVEQIMAARNGPNNIVEDGSESKKSSFGSP
jgi:hypothetical protein